MISSTRTIGRSLVARASRPTLSYVTKRGYHENIVEHFENPRNVGSFQKDEEGVGTVSSFRVFDCRWNDILGYP